MHDATLSTIITFDIGTVFLPWILTWFAHSLNDVDYISRIYDFLLSSEPYSIIYVCAGFIIGTRELLLETVKEHGEGAEVNK